MTKRTKPTKAARNGIGTNNKNVPQQLIDEEILVGLREHLVDFTIETCEAFRLNYLMRFLLERYAGDENAERAYELLGEMLAEATPRMKGTIFASVRVFKAQIRTKNLSLKDRARGRQEIDQAIDSEELVAKVLEGQIP